MTAHHAVKWIAACGTPRAARMGLGICRIIRRRIGQVIELVYRYAFAHNYPDVFIVGDPVGAGLVASLARPTGNLTGVSILAVELIAKQLELISEVVPQARVIALLVNPNNPDAERVVRDGQDAARAKGVQLTILKAATESEIDTAFATLAQLRAGALLVSPLAGASSSWCWHPAMLFRRSILGVRPWRPAV